ncbi:MAG: radical SAM protein [bacterium]
MVRTPAIMVYPVTYRCNARCIMCSIWKKRGYEDELTFAELEKLCGSPLLQASVRKINLTGGECFLRDDICGIVELLARRFKNLREIGLASNGFMPDMVVKTVERMIASVLPTDIALSIGISLDGFGAVHDRVRGVPGGFAKAGETIRRLKELESLYWPRFGVSVGTNINAVSCESLDETCEFLRKNDIHATFTPAVVSDLFFDNTAGSTGFELTEEQKGKAVRFFDGLRKRGAIDGFYHKFAKTWLLKSRRSAGCPFQDRGFFLDANGDVYPCKSFRKFRLGNIRDRSFDDIWRNTQTQKIYDLMRPHCKHCGCNCFLYEARPAQRLYEGVRKIITGR